MAAPKKPKTKSLHELSATWEDVAVAEARTIYDIMEVTDGDVALDDLFGDEPESFRVHRGALRLEGPLDIENCGRHPPTIFVVEGDLTVTGPLTLVGYNDYSVLWVRGALTVTDLEVAVDAQLMVEGSLHVSGVLATYVCDAGHLVVRGSTTATAWVSLGDRGVIELGDEPRTRIIKRDELASALDPTLVAQLQTGDPFKHVRAALLASRPILAA